LTSNGAARADAAGLARDPLVLEDLLENGQGVGRIGGLVTFVTGGLPGERVRIAVDAVKKNYASGHAVAVETPSPDRVEPGCPVFPACGGCQTLHLRYAAELVWKRRLVADALARIGGIEGIDVRDVVSAQTGTQGYRNKVALVCADRAGARQLGFFAARSHRLVPVEGCPVLLDRLDAAVKKIIGMLRAHPHAMRDVSHVVARASATGSELVVCFSERRQNGELHSLAPRLHEEIPDLTGVVASWDPEGANAIFGRRFGTLWGSPTVRERVGEAQFAFGVASFFQINTAILERLAAKIVELLGGARRVVDLYCGVGTFGVMLGLRGIATTGVESFGSAVGEARENAAHNRVVNAAFEHLTASAALAGERGATLLAGADAVILDPPRKGCESDVLDAIARQRVPRILYVSCNHATLARDAKALVASGYRLGAVTPYDMFPHTGHVEALAEFEFAR